ncbi:hypothetical protein [Paracoccus ravus]|uniref:hypothetical protein n=1 Tax=Paracoccus ravus TaxID=2447760 RepID=UPI00106E18E1|nr:hypothetical protein [Paracoccus ravus]
MVKLVRDIERIKFERRKVLLAFLRNVGVIFLVMATLGIYRQDWASLTIGCVVGACLLGGARYLRWRWRDILSWKPPKR